jgi:hypothetical protein
VSNGDGTFNDFTTRGTADHYAVEVETRPNNEPRVLSKGQWMTADINGDGRTDLVNNQADNMIIWLATENNDFQIIDDLDRVSGQFDLDLDGEWLSGDLNGDGLDDIVKATSTGSPRKILSWLSKGDGSFIFKSYVVDGTTGGLLGLMDANGDGLDDLVAHRGTLNLYYAYISDGNGQFHRISFTGQPFGSAYDNFSLLGDFNGDGNKDIMITHCSATPDLMLSQMSGKPGQMENFSIEKGASIDLEYEPSSKFENDHDGKYLPFVVQTLTEMTINDGVADTDQASITIYQYHGGLYDPVEREFRGFEWTKQFNPDGSKSLLFLRFCALRSNKSDSNPGALNVEIIFARVLNVDIGRISRCAKYCTTSHLKKTFWPHIFVGGEI